jgi:hypothetical protein
MFKPKVVLADDYCEPVHRVYTATIDYSPKPTCTPCYDESVYVRGAQGLSAYELAVKNGFVGTLAQWLATLSGGGGSVTPAEYIPFTAAAGEIVLDYTISSRQTLYPTPTFEVYSTDGSIDTSVGGYGVTIVRIAGIIATVTLSGLFGDGYILLKA